jgi:uncharacterized HAD superfamily protein
MIIGVDLDEVLADLLAQFLKFYNAKHNTHFERNQFLSYRWWETIGGTHKEAIDEYYEFWASAYPKDIEPVAGSVEAIKALCANHTLFLITSRQHVFRSGTEEWLNSHFPNQFSKIFFTNHNAKEGRAQSKAEICRVHGVQLLIEDDIDHATECAAEGIPVLLLDAPWNRKPSLPAGITAVSSWRQILLTVP